MSKTERSYQTVKGKINVSLNEFGKKMSLISPSAFISICDEVIFFFFHMLLNIYTNF